MYRWNDYKNGIYAFCANYLRPHLAAVHMVVEHGRVAFVDTGTNESLVFAQEALAKVGLNADAVDYVILTHIHLDHAGGAGAFMQAFPNARLVVHARGSRHMASPAKLVDAVKVVYGSDYVERVYGDILPVPQERIIEASEGLVLKLADRELVCIDAPGHAKHHICVLDKKAQGYFTGDTFGISYRELDVMEGDQAKAFIFPTTTPSQFEPAAMLASIQRMMASQPQAMYLTHFGQVNNVAHLAAELQRFIRTLCSLAEARKEAGEQRHALILADITRFLLDEAAAFGCTLPEQQILEVWGQDLELNAQGLGVWLDNGMPSRLD